MKANPKNMPGFGLVTWLGLAFLYLPIFAVIAFSFNSGRLVTVWEGFSFEWYPRALGNHDLQRATMNSLIVAVGATFIGTVIALAAALALHGGGVPKPVKTASYTMMALPLLVPEIVIAVTTMAFFAAINLRLGLINVLIAHIVFCIPFAYAPIRARIATIPKSMSEAAKDLYADEWQAFRHVTLPLLTPGIFSGALLAFITSLDDFIITLMVAPPGASTLPVEIYSKVKRGITPEINAAASMLLAFSIFIVLLSYIINRKKVI
ncbi:MAG TPA: ABC transporter permease [Alphaproteobacteria bacterium]|nr:ABC transporter permease [Alphaproteobacteria bacterium]HCS23456.1 spermidine/putrescine ABC transporter permease PotC [Rhodospirillaceae bacterium]HRI75730.1 ABC transporter permease [Alphaproteobacteria bacterium]HRJ65629.1 ABC transporter permease [Alphaproteobacteria bacterium]